MAGVQQVVLPRDAGQTGVGRLHQGHFARNRFHAHLTSRGEVHWPVYPEVEEQGQIHGWKKDHEGEGDRKRDGRMDRY
jgi:hypothetical protein